MLSFSLQASYSFTEAKDLAAVPFLANREQKMIRNVSSTCTSNSVV